MFIGHTMFNCLCQSLSLYVLPACDCMLANLHNANDGDPEPGLQRF